MFNKGIGRVTNLECEACLWVGGASCKKLVLVICVDNEDWPPVVAFKCPHCKIRQTMDISDQSVSMLRANRVPEIKWNYPKRDYGWGAPINERDITTFLQAINLPRIK